MSIENPSPTGRLRQWRARAGESVKRGVSVLTGEARRERERIEQQRDYKTIYTLTVASLANNPDRDSYGSEDQLSVIHWDVGNENLRVRIATRVKKDAEMPQEPDTVSLDISKFVDGSAPGRTEPSKMSSYRNGYEITKASDGTYDVVDITLGRRSPSKTGRQEIINTLNQLPQAS